jgi:hypothetical protein
MTNVVGSTSGDSPHKLATGTRHFEQALRVDRSPSALSFAAPGFLPATQGQRSKDQQKVTASKLMVDHCFLDYG